MSQNNKNIKKQFRTFPPSGGQGGDRKFYTFLLLILLFSILIHGCSRQSTLTLKKMLVGYAGNPISIDVPNPRFSWVIKAEERNKLKSAYRILVVTNEKKLKNENADIWESGKVNSSETIQMEKQKPSRINCFEMEFGKWKVHARS